MPYIIVFLLAMLGSYYFGKHVCQGEHATDVASIQKQAIDAANTESKAATKLAVQQIAREADARVRAAGIRRKGEIDAIAKAKPECARDAESLRLLVDAISDANGQSTTSSSVPDPVQPTPDANRR